MLRFLPVVMLIPFPILNSLNDCLEFGVHYNINRRQIEIFFQLSKLQNSIPLPI